MAVDGTWKKLLDFGGKMDHITLGLIGLWLVVDREIPLLCNTKFVGGARVISRDTEYVTECLFNSNFLWIQQPWRRYALCGVPC